MLLEPIMDITITVPDEFMGDVMSDLTTRRGRVQGTDQERGNAIVHAQVPLAEIQRYATDLRSFTQGRGIYTDDLLALRSRCRPTCRPRSSPRQKKNAKRQNKASRGRATCPGFFTLNLPCIYAKFTAKSLLL